MKKIILNLTVVIACLLSTSIIAQTNSVELKNSGGTLLGSYSSVAAAYAGIPTTITQGYIIELTSTYTGANETFPITFSAKTGASSANTITLRPAAGVSAVSIAGTNAGAGLIILDNTDFMIIDGRPGGTGTNKALTITNNGTTSNTAGVALLNGASNNIIKWTKFIANPTGTSVTRGVFIGAGASNNDNLIEFNYFTGVRNLLTLNGSTSTPNFNTIIYGNEFENPKFAAMWIQSGNNGVIIDSNFIFSSAAGGSSSTGSFGILADQQADTMIIRNNHIFNFDNGTNTVPVKAINLRSFADTTTHSVIVNNFISLTLPNSTSSAVFGIEYGSVGSTKTSADIFFNTVLIGGTSASTSSDGSAAFRKSTTGASEFNLKNNLFINERSGGNGNHVAVSIINISGLFNFDYNNYFSTTGDLANYSGTIYTNLAAYQALFTGAEVNTTNVPVQFVSNVDLHLTGSSIGNPNLYGISIPSVTRDIDNQLRGVPPYKGADEATIVPISCTGTPNPGVTVASSTNVCPGNNVIVNLSGINLAIIGSYSFQWQASADGINYINLPGTNNDSITVPITATTYFRSLVTCTNSGLSDTSTVIQINAIGAPVIGNIGFTNNNNVYNFTANGVQNATSFSWNFGDGDSSNLMNPSHTYNSNGTFTVTLIVKGCGGATATTSTTVTVATCFSPPAGSLKIATDSVTCMGDTTFLTLTGLDPVEASYFSYQWQTSVNGINFTDLPVAVNNDTLKFYHSTPLYFTVIVTCNTTSTLAVANPVQISIIDEPVAGTIQATPTGLDVNFSAAGTVDGKHYLWYFGDGNTSTAVNPSHTYGSDGNYTVSLVVSNKCGSDSISSIVNLSTGIKNPSASAANMHIYPNPIMNEFTIDLQDINEASTLRIMDVTGRVIAAKAIKNEVILEFSATELALGKGVYIIELSNTKVRLVKSIVIQ